MCNLSTFKGCLFSIFSVKEDFFLLKTLISFYSGICTKISCSGHLVILPTKEKCSSYDIASDSDYNATY